MVSARSGPVTTEERKMPVESFSRKITRNILWNIVGQGWLVLLTFLATPFMIHRLGVELYGIYVLVGILVDYFSFMQFGIVDASVKYMTERLARGEPRRVQEIFWTAMLSQTAIGLAGALMILALSAFLVDHVFRVPEGLAQEARLAVAIGAASFPLSMVTGVTTGTLRAVGRFDLLNMTGIVWGNPADRGRRGAAVVGPVAVRDSSFEPVHSAALPCDARSRRRTASARNDAAGMEHGRDETIVALWGLYHGFRLRRPDPDKHRKDVPVGDPHGLRSDLLLCPLLAGQPPGRHPLIVLVGVVPRLQPLPGEKRRGGQPVSPPAEHAVPPLSVRRAAFVFYLLRERVSRVVDWYGLRRGIGRNPDHSCRCRSCERHRLPVHHPAQRRGETAYPRRVPCDRSRDLHPRLLRSHSRVWPDRCRHGLVPPGLSRHAAAAGRVMPVAWGCLSRDGTSTSCRGGSLPCWPAGWSSGGFASCGSRFLPPRT